MKLNSETVEAIYIDCLFRDGEDTDKRIAVEGIGCSTGFHPARIEGNRSIICAMLDELPDAFQELGGGGMSFLYACENKNGIQWTGLHQRMDQLFQLGLAIGKVKCLMPREMWNLLPGNMPYYVVLSKTEAALALAKGEEGGA